MFTTSSEIAPVSVHTTANRGMTPEEVADLLLPRVIHIADTAPPAIRDQAVAFRDQLRPLLAYYLRMAVQNDRSTIETELRNAGHPELADYIRRL